MQNPTPYSKGLKQKEPKEKDKKTIQILLWIVTVVVSLSIGAFCCWFILKNKICGGDPCTYNGNTYKDKDAFVASDGCNTCTCNNGEVTCTTMSCPSD